MQWWRPDECFPFCQLPRYSQNIMKNPKVLSFMSSHSVDVRFSCLKEKYTHWKNSDNELSNANLTHNTDTSNRYVPSSHEKRNNVKGKFFFLFLFRQIPFKYNENKFLHVWVAIRINRKIWKFPKLRVTQYLMEGETFFPLCERTHPNIHVTFHPFFRYITHSIKFVSSSW